MQLNNIKRDIINILSKLEYEPISEMDLSYPDHINCSIFYKKKFLIKTNNGNFPIEFFLNFTDTSLLNFPSIYITITQLETLKKNYPHIQDPIPHIELSNILYKKNNLLSICYQLENSNIVPRDNLPKLLNIVERHLTDFFLKITNKVNYIKEYTEDFGGILFSLFKATNLTSKIWYLIIYKDQFFLIDLITKKELNTFILKIDENKTPDFSRLINSEKKVTIDNFINLINNWDKLAYKKLLKYLKKKSFINKILISWRSYIFGISFHWPLNEKKGLKNPVNKNLLKNYVTFHIINMYDLKASILRNLPSKSKQGLFDKKIFQIGLGAIGGYMADALIKVGAGFENEFLIIDDDYYENENIARHLLGLNYVGISKTDAFINYVRQTYYQTNKVRAEFKNIKDYSLENFIQGRFNLIIDATGSIEVQEYINEIVLNIPLNLRPIILHLWIYGNGECVQGLWVDPEKRQKNGGCILCLGSSGNGLYPEYIPVLDTKVEQRSGVCAAFTPYTISGGMMATSLGINIILEWLATGNVKNNYQTRYNSEYQGKKIKDIKLLANALCRFCGERHD